MSSHVFRLYYRKHAQELWTKIYEDNFVGVNLTNTRNSVIFALEKNGYEFIKVDHFEGVVKEKYSMIDKNESSFFDNLDNYNCSESNINVLLNYLVTLKHFVENENLVELEELRFTNSTEDLIKIIKAYEKYRNEVVLTKNEMDFFVKAIESDYHLLIAYLFFEFMIERFSSGEFSRYAVVEVNDFYSLDKNKQLSHNKNIVLSTLISSALKFQRSNQISIDSKTNLLSYSDFFNMVKFIKLIGYKDFITYRVPKEEYLGVYKDINLTEEQKDAINFSMIEAFKIQEISNQNIEMKRNQNLEHKIDEKENSLASSLIKYENEQIARKKKKKIVSVLIPILVIVMIVLISLVAKYINETKYTSTILNAYNYNTFVTINPSIVETDYYSEGLATPSKYIYDINLNENYSVDYDINLVLMIQFTTTDGTFNKKITSLSFESQDKISDVTIYIAPDYNENLKILKSDLESLNIFENSIQEYDVIVTLSNYYMEEKSLTLENYSSFISINVDSPVDHLKNGLYQYTTYNITINQKSVTQTILQANVTIRYDLSSTQFSSSSTQHLVTFTYSKQSITDSFGRYPYYEYEINNISGKIIIRSLR